MIFSKVYCNTEVVIFNAKLDRDAQRMDNTKVYVSSKDEGTRNLCGVLEVTEDYTKAGQTYRCSKYIIILNLLVCLQIF